MSPQPPTNDKSDAKHGVGSEEKIAERETGIEGGGASGGGAYPNPHTGKKGGDNEGFMGHGGQTEQAYHGPTQLGDKKLDDNANAATGSK